MNTQKGFAHIVLVIGILVLIVGALSAVIWKNYAGNLLSPKQVTYQEYTSITGSGLTFTYPDNWTFLPPDKINEFTGSGKSASSLLFSQELDSDSGPPQINSDHVCVTLSEFSGEWPRSYGPPNSEKTDFEFTLGANKVGLIAHEDDTNGYFSARLVSIDPFERGASYIALKNDYFLKATAQKNCHPNENPKQRDIDIEIDQAKEILKSVRLVE